jgi:hypothetical protein
MQVPGWTCAPALSGLCPAPSSEDLAPFDLMFEGPQELTFVRLAGDEEQLLEAIDLCQFNAQDNPDFRRFLNRRTPKLVFFVKAQDSALLHKAALFEEALVVPY